MSEKLDLMVEAEKVLDKIEAYVIRGMEKDFPDGLPNDLLDDLKKRRRNIDNAISNFIYMADWEKNYKQGKRVAI